MVSPTRLNSAYGRKANDSNGFMHRGLQQPILSVAPLRCIPYAPKGCYGPPTIFIDDTSEKKLCDAEPAMEVGPAIIFIPSYSNQEFNKILANTKNGFAMIGSVALGKIGPAIGQVDIAESRESYLFRVSLPGVKMDGNKFECNIRPDGKVVIKGVTTTGEKTVQKQSQVFKMLTENLCPPGRFSVEFNLPGPVNTENVEGQGADGILECIVKKN